MKKIMKKNLILILPILIILLSIFTPASLGLEKIQGKDGIIYGELLHQSYDEIVLIIAGSGPTDMNGNTPIIDGRNDSLKMLAYELKEKNISTLRYDKRTAGESRKVYKDTDMTFDDFISDTESIIDYLKDLGYKKIYLLGHSQGGTIALRAGKTKNVDGIISLNASGFTIDYTLEKQFSESFSDDSKEMNAIKSLRQGKLSYELPEDHYLFSIKKQEFLLTWMKYDPAELIKEINCPVLLIQGESDLQTSIEDLNSLHESKPDSKIIKIKNMNHVLKTVETEKQNIDSYSDPSYKISKELITSIVKFIK